MRMNMEENKVNQNQNEILEDLSELPLNNAATNEVAPEESDVSVEELFDAAPTELTESYSPNPPTPANETIFNPVTVGGPAHEKNGGLRIFVTILCAVIILCIVLGIGYVAGRSYEQNAENINLELADRPDVSEQKTALQVYENSKKSIVGVLVYSKDGKSQATGSGIVYSKDGYIVTNDHLLTDIPSPNFIISTSDGQEFEAEFVASDLRSDLAVLKAKGEFTPVELGNSDKLFVGERVVAIGYPAGLLEKPILTTGCISSVGRRVTSTTAYSTKLIQTDAAINPGSSGGGLLNMYGQLIGITSSKSANQTDERVGFAIPSATVKMVVEALLKDGNVKDRAKLGVSYYEITSATAKLNNLPTGLYVAEIAAESDLSKKDVQAGDIITHINDTKITNANIALDIIDACKAGDVLNLTVYKAENQKSISVSITLVSDPGSSSYTQKETQKTESNQGTDENEFDFPFGD